MKQKTAVQSLSENTRKAIIIAAIVVVAVIILSIALALILRPIDKLPDDESGSSSGSSSLTIRNGDFAYTSSDDTAYPKTAQNWTRYGYKAKSTISDTHDFASISTHEQAVMGIVDTSDWATVQSDLANEGLEGIESPGTVGRDDADELTDDNVYMIATHGATAASILSDSFSVPSGASVKITLLLNSYQLKSGHAVIMIQKSTVSALDKYWYAYDFEVEQSTANEWVTQTFHIFNREASTQYIRISIGIGNVYSGEKGLDLVNNEPISGEGVLFIDDIKYETVTANDYREVVDSYEEEDSDTVSMYQPFKILENVDIVEESTYLTLTREGTPLETLDYDGYLKETTDTDGGEYSPFTKRDDFVQDVTGEEYVIYKLANSSDKGAIEFRLSSVLTITPSLIQKDHVHISFWVRVKQINKVAKANIHVQTREDDSSKWEDLTSGSWTDIATSQDIDTDSNAGWVKYDIYLKPSAGTKEISILFSFGDEKESKLAPKGTMYVTTPAYEFISSKDFNNASSGSYVKKFDLTGNSAVVTVTNGSFSSLNNTGLQPSSWTPVFAGDNAIYNDGLGNVVTDSEGQAIVLDRSSNAVAGSGVVSEDGSTHWDDEQNKILKISNNVETSFGYLSSSTTLSARTAYVISVVAKASTPYIYLLNTDTTLDRKDRVIASITSADAQNVEDESILGEITVVDTLGEGWARYFFIVVTGSESQSVRLALFNGSLDGTTRVSGEVFYDQVEVKTLGSYSLGKYEDPEEGSYEETHYEVNWTDHPFIETDKDSVEKYGKNFGELLEKLSENLEEGQELTLWGITITQPTDEEWEEMRLIPEEDDDDTTDDTTTTESSEVDLGLLFSVISSVALVAALGVVIVVKLFRNKKSTPKAA